MNYLLDTNILLNMVRNTSLYQEVNRNYDLFIPSNTSITSFVCVAEIRSIAIRNGWGHGKMLLLEDLEKSVQPIWINNIAFVERYVEIDTFSMGKHPTKPLSTSARKMGKNDLWIAATASLLNASLITTDADFDHLNDVFLNVIKIPVS
jgi:tRNA(fMet)-specific endonuclease VapC